MQRAREMSLAALRNEPYPIEPKQKYTVDDFQPGDALGVARLYYAVYGEMFPIDAVYDPEELVRRNEGKDQHQVVGRTEKGDIIGLYAIFRNPPGHHIMEGGSWIVHPAYRKTTLAIRMAERIHLHPPPDLGLDVMFGQSVTDHQITQKMAHKFNSRSCALEVEALPARPEHEEGWSEGRISLLDGFIIYQDRPHTVFLPRFYAAILRSLYAERALSRHFSEDRAPKQAQTRGTIQSIDNADMLKITVEQPGIDFAEYLANSVAHYPDRHVYQLILPLWQPGTSLAVEAARSAGYFLGGLLPLWFDQDGLLLQKVAGDPDFTKIKLFTDEAKDLLRLIVADRHALPRHGGHRQ
ncbi:hypothetical protein KQH41_01375 [bacterium]|nr:hypothetical protein [bacterium]